MKNPNMFTDSEVIFNQLKSFINKLEIPENDSFKVHPSIVKGHQTIEQVHIKLETVMKVLREVPPMIVHKAHHYYLQETQLEEYAKLFIGSQFITGPVHSGKTVYLMSRYIIALMISASYPPNAKRIIYIEYFQLIHNFKACITNKEISETSLFDNYKKADVLFIDDLFSGGMVTEYAMNILYTILDYRHINYLPTLVTSNLMEANISAMDNGERLLRRLTEHAEILQFIIKE